ncbi:hypothetical protein [Mycobacterium vicinigordonae]|uniref:Uncharacterized protein n=1 Tax=Mycobacterium vicinigordonae TaxID=1719132 RepID=A0A7D6I7I1_9MYCO|nr:hypothetical protein [Mycobacterium vicinigordonae]QLL07636.1 hypothetical protein H0P51_01005 [Mycobacterium vicinigordonae]
MGHRVIAESAVNDARPDRWSADVDIVTMVTVGVRVRSVRDYQQMPPDRGLRFIRNVAATSGYLGNRGGGGEA